ncbi:Arabinose-proton symporter (Arabinose transporter) [Quaeritorhiza haematococci]|nr:Arabinose-proton symporter (Arabinose transporter) [Quaeritorhiza haematococci]
MFAAFHSVREYLNPILKNSKFKETGVLTPEEFVAAGDFLVYKCPTWSWASGLDSKRRDYLPADKQYLITRNVPCLRRVKAMEYDAGEDGEEEFTGGDGEGDEGWIATHTGRKDVNPDDIVEIDGEEEDSAVDAAVEAVAKEVAGMTVSSANDSANSGNGSVGDSQPNYDDIPDMDEDEALDDSGVEEPEDAAAVDKILRTRTYDMSITYDKYYQTPRVWLFGYDEHRRPLTSVQIFEDISQDHAKKTVTIETHPHENIHLASIHPCKHANVMKKIIDHLIANGKQDTLRVDQYLILFLKFMSSVLPTMDYDYTVSMEG